MENTPVRSLHLLNENEEQNRGVPRYGWDDCNLKGEEALEERVALLRTLLPTNPFLSRFCWMNVIKTILLKLNQSPTSFIGRP